MAAIISCFAAKKLSSMSTSIIIHQISTLATRRLSVTVPGFPRARDPTEELAFFSFIFLSAILLTTHHHDRQPPSSYHTQHARIVHSFRRKYSRTGLKPLPRFRVLLVPPCACKRSCARIRGGGHPAPTQDICHAHLARPDGYARGREQGFESTEDAYEGAGLWKG